MLQDEANHFSAAVEMIRHGLAVLIFTDLSRQFRNGYRFCSRRITESGLLPIDEPQSYLLHLVNPLMTASKV